MRFGCPTSGASQMLLYSKSYGIVTAAGSASTITSSRVRDRDPNSPGHTGHTAVVPAAVSALLCDGTCGISTLQSFRQWNQCCGAKLHLSPCQQITLVLTHSPLDLRARQASPILCRIGNQMKRERERERERERSGPSGAKRPSSAPRTSRLSGLGHKAFWIPPADCRQSHGSDLNTAPSGHNARSAFLPPEQALSQ